jgi:hypothetical protein
VTDFPHLRVTDAPDAIGYTYAGGGRGGPFPTPSRDRVPHAAKLRAEFEQAADDFDTERDQAEQQDRELDRLTLTVRSNPKYPLKLESLDRPGSGIELLSVAERDLATEATISVPRTKVAEFLKLLDEYEQKNTKKGKPRNKELIESIASARLAVVEDFWRDPGPFPDSNRQINWEVWLRTGDLSPDAVHAQFAADCTAAEIRAHAHYVHFPDRVVTLAFGSATQIARSLALLTTIAELGRAKELASDYLRQEARFQAELVEDFLQRVTFAPASAPAVCLLDTGVNRGHPLLAPAIDTESMHTVDEAWGTADRTQEQHGTGMAGLALYGDLAVAFNSGEPISLRHRLESAKILPPPPQANEPEVYGYVTEQGVSRAIISAPDRNRVLCLAVTSDDRDAGAPSSWSGTIDQMCAGVTDDIPKLMFVSAGNVHNLYAEDYRYPRTNLDVAGVEDPAQAWNVVTVGAYTDQVIITDPDFWEWNPVAPDGDLCPTSRTSLAWGEASFAGWPIKPDIVLEGGNYATNGHAIDAPEDLALLTTMLGADGRLLQRSGDTSAATADASRLAAMLWAFYPELWPETIRALVVHSARWTEAMQQRLPGNAKIDVHKRLRCYGYGVPDLGRARYSAENAVTLVYEGAIQPFKVEQGEAKTNEMHIHTIPWPVELLQEMGETEVTMRVTLSYFIEPSPGRRGWTTSTSHRYQSHGLRFDIIRLQEDDDAFRRRLTRAAWEDPKRRPDNAPDNRNWVVGSDGRTNGSIHCDWWEGLASDLAVCNQIAVYPVIGWWRERKHKGRVASTARYSLIVSIETAEQNVDLYAAITSQAEIQALVESE